MTDRRDDPAPQKAWGWYNFGLLVGIAHTKRLAVAAAEDCFGEPWAVLKSSIEIHRVIVTKVKP